MNRGIGGERYCMLCGRKGDHWTADCPMKDAANRGPQSLPDNSFTRHLQKSSETVATWPAWKRLPE